MRYYTDITRTFVKMLSVWQYKVYSIVLSAHVAWVGFSMYPKSKSIRAKCSCILVIVLKMCT